MLFVLFCFCLVGLLVAYYLKFIKRQQELKDVTWDELLAQLQETNVLGLREIAACYLNPDERQLRIEPGVMWETVGGLEGIEKLTENCEVMLKLATYAERWNDLNGRVISEIMRRDALRMKSSVLHIERAMLTRRGLVYLGLELQEAISSYCLMRARLLGMYRECQAGLLVRLEAAL